MSPRQRVLAALWLTAGIQAAAWSIDYVVRRVRRSLRITEGRLHP